MQSITAQGQTFTKRASRVKLPYIDQVAGYYLFGGNAASSLTNLAFGASQNLTAIATPTYGAGYAVIDGTNGFDTGLLLDAPFTQIAVGVHTVANAVLAFYGRGAGNTDNFVDMLRLDDSIGQLDGWPDGAQNQKLPGLIPGAPTLTSAGYRLMAQSWGGTGTRHSVYTMVGNSLYDATASTNTTKTITPTHTLKFGTGYASGGPEFRVATGVLAAKVLTVQQIYEIGIYLRALLLARGITML